MVDPEHPRVFTIPPHRAFADALAAGLLAMHDDDRMGLAKGIILVPTNRAARAIQDAFVRRVESGLLLPRLVPVGDPDIGETLGSALDPIGAGSDIPPAVAPIERTMRLATLVDQLRRNRGEPVNGGEAIRLARDLGATLDQLLIEKVDPRKLEQGVEAELSKHWQVSLDQLEVVLSKWPDELKRIGKIDMAERRNRLLDHVARRWKQSPPSGFVVAAGIVTTAPAVAGLLEAVARLEKGMVVLPGLDRAMPQAEWDALGPHKPDPDTGRRKRSIETHPQFALKLLLDRMSVARDEVSLWRRGGGRDAPAVRSRAIGNALSPAAFTGKWNELPPRERRLSGIRALEAATPGDEAQAIAIAMRETLEEPGRTAALVTPDRMLARRVSAHLRRWGIAADDSAGRPLADLPSGTLLRALADVMAERFAPVPLLALLKHPLVHYGEGRGSWLVRLRRFDKAMRGPRPRPGLDGVTAHLERLRDEAAKAGRSARAEELGEIISWWRETAAQLEPLARAAAPTRGFVQRLAAIREVAGELSGEAVWAGHNGRRAAEFYAECESRAALGPGGEALADLPAMLDQLMRLGDAVRPPQGGHPRLYIWGLLEARLQQTDLMILGGLNEGVWPGLPSPDPWLAPRLRAELGLPGLERRIGLSAHDLAMALGAPQVLCTRARRDAGGPTVASRFWLRMEAMTGGMTRAPRFKAWAEALDRPKGDPQPADRPEPTPPAKDRPKRISVTRVDRLKADPFAFYAQSMLGLSLLDPVDAEPSPAWRGSAVHAILEGWFEEDRCDPAKLLPRAERLLRRSDSHPLMRALWEPRLLEPIAWIAQTVDEMRAAGRKPIAAEILGSIEIAGVTLTGTADRIDRLGDSGLAIIDYKTGMPPRPKEVAAGFRMQLGLLGLIADRGGFEGISGVSKLFEYWSLGKRDDRLGYIAEPFVKRGKSSLTTDNFVVAAAEHFTDAAGRWLTGGEPFTAKLHPEYAPYGEYDQLMRRDEWYGRKDG